MIVVEPTSNPTMDSTRYISLRPTIAATAMPSPSLTVAPTTRITPPTFIVISPITIQQPNTIAPSIGSTDVVETLGPTFPPAIASEEQSDCTLRDGVYGTTDDDTAWREIVQYTYQVETVVTVLEDMTLPNVLGRLEYNMTERMIPTLFGGDCTPRVRALFGDVSAVTGLSAQPADVIHPDTLCESRTGLCFVVDGKLTVYSSQELDLAESVKQKMLQEIESGYFNTVDPSITRVAVYTDGSMTPNKSDSVIIPPSSGRNRKPLIGTMVGLFGTLAMLALVLVRRQWGARRKDRNGEAVALRSGAVSM